MLYVVFFPLANLTISSHAINFVEYIVEIIFILPGLMLGNISTFNAPINFPVLFINPGAYLIRPIFSVVSMVSFFRTYLKDKPRSNRGDCHEETWLFSFG